MDIFAVLNKFTLALKDIQNFILQIWNSIPIEQLPLSPQTTTILLCFYEFNSFRYLI